MTTRKKGAGAKRRPPQQERALVTYDRLLSMAGELLGEVGIERISTNLICKRAGLTPPALYRYFTDKYAVLEALGERLMRRQNAVLEEWLAAYASLGRDAIEAHTEELLRRTAAVTSAEPGAVWTLRALRAVPQLAHVRLDSHRLVTGQLVEVYARYRPDLRREDLWRRVRVAVEFGYATDEMLIEEERIPRDLLLKEAARIINFGIFG